MRSIIKTVLLFAISGCGAVRVGSSAPEEPLPRDAAVVIGELDNGLRYYIRRNAEPTARAELRLAVNAGSVLEDQDQRGLAHFLEHMAFNGTRNYARNDLIDYLESLGMRFGPDINAYTSYDETVYILTVPIDSPGVLEKGFEVMRDWADGITLAPDEIERERGVVIEEWRVRQSAAMRMQQAQLPVLMGRSRYTERDPIGTRESLEHFDHGALRRFYRDWYRPDLMAVVAVGDFDPAEVKGLIEESFGGLAGPEERRHRREFGVTAHDETLVSVATDPEATNTQVSLYLKREPVEWETVATFRRWLAESLASAMLTNRLSELTQRPGSPIVDISSFHGRFIRPLAAHILTARVPEGGATEGLRALLIEAERAARHGFTETEMEREKREMLLYAERGYVERGKKTSSSFASEYVSHFLYGGTPLSPEDEYDLYRTLLPLITLEEVNAASAPWMRSSDRVVLVRAPEVAHAPAPPTEATLKRVVAEVESAEITPYSDEFSQEPLMASLPEPGRVVSEDSTRGAGVIEWRLSNGARVLVKPTGHREQEILFAARSAGGLSLLADADYIAGLTATAVVQAGGLGHLSSTDLRKRLAGTYVGVGADISEMHEGLSGAGSPNDLELLLQLVHLKFTAPRADSVAFLAYRDQAREGLRNRAASPEAAFADSLRRILAQHHPRVRTPSVAIFDSLNLHRSIEIYRERFADAADFTFYFVGSFDPATLRPLVERYIGSLPAAGGGERWQDHGIRAPDGVVKRVVRQGVEQKGLAQIVFTGPMEIRPESVQTLSIMADLLEIRLRELLREELSGTYGVSVRGGGSGIPLPRYQVSIGFGSDPERIPELTDAIFGEIARLRREAPAQHELAKVQEIQLRAREVDERTNQFWIAQLLSYDQQGWSFDDMLRGRDRISGITPEDVRDAGRRYLDPERYVHLSLVPEAAGATGRIARD